MKVSELYNKIKKVKLKHSVITWSLLVLCVITMLYSDYRATSITSKNIAEIQKEVSDLKDSQTYILLQLENEERHINKVNTTIVKQNKQIDELFVKYGKKYGIESKLLKSIAIVESGINHNVKPNGSAVGIMQIKPSTAKGVGIENVYTVEGNIEASAKYLSALRERYNISESRMLQMYNGGPRGANSSQAKKYAQKVQAIKEKL